MHRLSQDPVCTHCDLPAKAGAASAIMLKCHGQRIEGRRKSYRLPTKNAGCVTCHVSHHALCRLSE